MAFCRPRGGRAAPRYHHIKDAAEEKYFAALERREKEQPEQQMSQTDVYIHILNASIHYADEALSRLRRRLGR